MTFRTFALLSATLALAGCTFPATETPPAGASTSIGGVDIWHSPPSRPYQVISTVAHEGPDDSASYADEEALVAQDAQKAGADGAVILYEVKAVSRMDISDGREIMAPKVAAQLIKYQ
jgi:hypothetical protein